jgi:hypothetical protein
LSFSGKSRAAGSEPDRSRIVVCSCPDADRRISLAWLWPAFSVKPPARVTAPNAVVDFSSW